MRGGDSCHRRGKAEFEGMKRAELIYAICLVISLVLLLIASVMVGKI